MINMKNLTFDEFCNKCCDGLYEPKLPLNTQSTGYTQLRKMVAENINPATIDEIVRWENNPTLTELFSTPDIKYLRFLHPNLRPYIIQHWNIIKLMKLS